MSGLGHLPTIYRLSYALKQQALGRRTLVEKTGITESTVRTHLNKLRTAGYVVMTKEGTTLTPLARKAFATLFEHVLQVAELELQDLALDEHNAAALIAGKGEAFCDSWRYRDAAVRAGATGAILLVKRPESWTWSDNPIPLARQNPHDAAYLQQVINAQPGDGLVIAFGSTPHAAQNGLWQVLVELFPLQLNRKTKRRVRNDAQVLGH